MSIFGFFKGKKEEPEPQELSYEDYLETVLGLLTYATRNRDEDDDEYDDEYDDSEKED
ncbi:MAG TPA: hypothetical protein V6D21_10820 [Candidatus Obscuribacterales bacterium]